MKTQRSWRADSGILKPREEGSTPQRVMALKRRLQERTAALKSFRAQRALLHLLSRQLSLSSWSLEPSWWRWALSDLLSEVRVHPLLWKRGLPEQQFGRPALTGWGKAL